MPFRRNKESSAIHIRHRQPESAQLYSILSYEFQIGQLVRKTDYIRYNSQRYSSLLFSFNVVFCNIKMQYCYKQYNVSSLPIVRQVFVLRKLNSLLMLAKVKKIKLQCTYVLSRFLVTRISPSYSSRIDQLANVNRCFSTSSFYFYFNPLFVVRVSPRPTVCLL